MKFIGLVIGLLLIVSVVSAGLFGPDPTPVSTPVASIDTWTPVDKCWVYQPDTWNVYYSWSELKPGEIRYFVTYVNQDGHHELRLVDIDTWYSVDTRILTGGKFEMYQQGG